MHNSSKEVFIVAIQEQPPPLGIRFALSVGQNMGLINKFIGTNATVIHPVEFTKYSINGFETGSFVLSGKYAGQRLEMLVLGLAIGGHALWMAYITTPETFHSGLTTTVKPMVNSFRWIGQ